MQAEAIRKMLHIMDLSPFLNEFNPPFLVDNGLVAEDESEDSTVCDIVFQESDHEEQKKVLQDDATLSSILRRESSSAISTRKVWFPMEDDELVTYREPEICYSWIITNFLPAEKILQVYEDSCKHHKTIELDAVKKMILEVKNNTNYSAVLNLSSINLTNEVNETLEAVLRVSNFKTLLLQECKYTGETISELLNMIEYYESVCDIDISMNFDEIAWKCFCTACTNMSKLESLSFRSMTVNENFMRMLLNVIKNNHGISSLRFEACILVKLPSFYLVENLMTNTTLCELYLPSTGLYTKEADCIGRFLQKNFTLKVLDISNNCIGDRGLEVLAKGLTKQTTSNCGLSALIIFNNQITEKSGLIIRNIISECKNLHTLNIGFNNLTDEVISNIIPSLEATTSLEGLGLQCTLLTCKGMDYLAAAIQSNDSLQKINLKGNKAIDVPGLESLCQALTSSKIVKIEIDESNRSAHDPRAYIQVAKRLNAICAVNKTYKEANNEEIANISQLISRKMSLNCEPRCVIPGGSTDPPAMPRPTKNRFAITKVQDSPSVSRFEVIQVPADDVILGKFSNIRSSVSSNDSVDSLQLDADSD